VNSFVQKNHSQSYHHCQVQTSDYLSIMYNSSMSHEYHFSWQVDLKSSPAALWPFVADTNRFNHDTGLPPITQLPSPPDVPEGMRRLSFTYLGQHVEWDEAPFEWIFPYRFSVARYYRRGPLAQMRVLAEMTETPGGGTHLIYQVWARPANLFGHLAIRVQIGMLTGRRFEEIFRVYDALIQSGGTQYDLPGTANFAPGGRQRLDAARAAVAPDAPSQAVYDRLASLLENADDLALQRVRPYQLADCWQIPRRTVLETFLRAARAGLLDLRWELLCPYCRGAGASHAELSEVHRSTHCNFCDVDFNVDFDRQVEVIFRPSPTVRVIPEQLLFCLSGPQSAPHAVVNENLEPGEAKSLPTVLDAGRYNLSLLGTAQNLAVDVVMDGAAEAVLDVGNWPTAPLRLAPRPTLHLSNQMEFTQHLVLERAAWRDDAATAADVTSLQVFRDLFARQVLRAGDEIEIKGVTLMFTDLRDSTRMYRQIGDAPAFGRVRQHFDLLEEAIAAEGGAVVKTMGDAVMAVFRQPVMALRAIQKAHAVIRDLEGTPQLAIKVGIHTGPCIVVTLNERLDYFGSTVNLAARLHSLAEGGEVILSETVSADPEVTAWLGQMAAKPETFEALVKGFEQPFTLFRWRL